MLRITADTGVVFDYEGSVIAGHVPADTGNFKALDADDLVLTQVSRFIAEGDAMEIANRIDGSGSPPPTYSQRDRVGFPVAKIGMFVTLKDKSRLPKVG